MQQKKDISSFTYAIFTWPVYSSVELLRLRGCFYIISGIKEGLMNISILEKRSPKSYNLSVVHIVGKVSFVKLTLVKFGIFAAQKN